MRKGCLAALLFFSLGVVAGAQGSEAGKKQRLPVKLEFRLRSENRINYDLDGGRADNNYPLLQRFRFSVAPRWKSFSFLAQIQDSSVWRREESPYAPANFHLYQLYFQVPVAGSLKLRGGRQELMIGEERLLGAFGWDNRSRVFDAISFSGGAGAASLQVFAASLAVPRQRNFPRGQNLFGLAWKQSHQEREVEAYLLWLQDQRRLQGEKGPAKTRIVTSGFRFTGRRGGLKQNLELAWQGGRRAGDTHLAAALVYRSHFTWNARLKLAAGVEYSFASGDGDPRDGRSREFDNLFPTNHPFYGYMDLFGWRNLHDPKLIISLQPSGRLRLEAGYHDFWLVRSRGAWKNAGGTVLGRDPTGRSGHRVGGEVDLLASYNISSAWRFLLGYSSFFPGEFARRTRGADGAHFGYLQLLWSY